MFEFLRHRLQRPIPHRENLESPRYVRGSFRVHDDRSYLSAVSIDLLDIQVSKRSPAWRPTGLGLLLHPFVDFERKVLAVEFRDRAHDAVKEHSRGRLVDILGGGHQLRPCLLDCPVNLRIVESVPSQSVDFMHNDVVD
nr:MULTISPECIES: hypothetical protein [unclassified Rhodococcus (in: high G+C Gram-positive bacteria)]